MGRILKWWSRLLFAAMMLLAIPVVASAAENTEDISFSYPQYYQVSSSGSSNSFSSYFAEEFELYIKDQFANCKEEFSIEAFEIPYNENIATLLRKEIWYEMPEAFNVYGLGFLDSDGYFSTIYVSYRSFADTVEEYKACSDAMLLGADYLLDGLLDNSKLTDVEKALLLHDRLAIWTAYDYDNLVNDTLPDTVYTAYGALGKQSAVCMGYALAYMYLLEQVGIESDYCASDSMDHAWNIVYINNKGYHVDVTWDDFTPDMTGLVLHNNFLLSTQGIRATGHNGNDFITAPTDTTYDDYYWKNCNSSFVLVRNELYYADDSDETIRRAEGNVTETILDISNYWVTVDQKCWIGLSSLASMGNVILYSQPDGVYALDPITKATALVYAPDLSASEYHTVHGFKYERDYLYIYVTDIHEHEEEDLLKVYVEPQAGEFTVTFRDTDGSVISSNSYYFGDVPVQPTLDTTLGYDGYYEAWNNPVTICVGNAEYTKTIKKTDKYRVEFLNWDGSVWDYGWYELGDEVRQPANPSRPEDPAATYEFIGWYGPWVECIGHKTVEPFFQKHYKQYSITFLDWDGSIIEAGYFYYQDEVTMYEPFRNDDVLYSYEFVGWDKEITPCLGDAVYKAVYKATARVQSGWVQDGDTWYYMNKGTHVTGWLAYGPVWYYFNDDGTMLTGWLHYGGRYYYFDKAETNYGRMVVNKWIQDSGKWYYFDANGYRVTGEYTINGEKNLFDENGVWQGTVVSTQNGWVKENNKWFYYKNGAKHTGWLDLNGTWYYFNPRGEMTTGWLAYGPVWYYFNDDGVMRTGWLTYGGQHYYFDKTATNYGRMVVSKWIQDSGKWYYFDANGYRVTGSLTIGGKVYNFDKNGVCLNP